MHIHYYSVETRNKSKYSFLFKNSNIIQEIVLLSYHLPSAYQNHFPPRIKMSKKSKKSKNHYRLNFLPGQKLVKCSKETLKRLKISTGPLKRKNGLYSAPLDYLCPQVVRAHVVRLSPRILDLMRAPGQAKDNKNKDNKNKAKDKAADELIKKNPSKKVVKRKVKVSKGGKDEEINEGAIRSPTPPKKVKGQDRGQGGNGLKVIFERRPVIFEGGPLTLQDHHHQEGEGDEMEEILGNLDLDGQLPRLSESVEENQRQETDETGVEDEEEVQVIATRQLEPFKIDAGFAEELDNFITTYVLGDEVPDIPTDMDWDSELEFDETILDGEEDNKEGINKVDEDSSSTSGRSLASSSSSGSSTISASLASSSTLALRFFDPDVLDIMVDPMDIIPLPESPIKRIRRIQSQLGK